MMPNATHPSLSSTSPHALSRNSTELDFWSASSLGVAQSKHARLLLLGTAAAGPLSSLNGLLVALRSAALHGGHEAGGRLEGALEVAGGGLTVDVDLDQVVLEGALKGDDGLDAERVGVLQVEVHEGHHANAHKLATEGGLELGGVVGVDGGGHELALLAGANRGGLDVLEGGQV